MSELKLLPCPFCGGDAKVIEDSMLICGHRYWRIIHNSNDCPITDAFGIFRSSAKYSTAEKAIAAWNRRAQPGNSRQRALQTGVCPMCEDCPDGCPVETPNDSRNRPENEPIVHCAECEHYKPSPMGGKGCLIHFNGRTEIIPRNPTDFCSCFEWRGPVAGEESR